MNMISLFFPRHAYALTSTDLGFGVFSDFDNLNSITFFIVNATLVIGWAMVFIAIAYTINAVIYKLMNSDSEEAVQDFIGALKKMIIIAVLGLLLINTGFLYTFFGELLGYSGFDVNQGSSTSPW